MVAPLLFKKEGMKMYEADITYTIRQQEKNKWSIFYRLSRRITGRSLRKDKLIKAHSKSEADRAARKALPKVAKEFENILAKTNNGHTFGEVFEMLKHKTETRKRKPLSERTKQTYSDDYDTYIKDALGTKFIKDITEKDLHQYFELLSNRQSRKTKQPLSARTQKKIYIMVNAIMNFAVKNGYAKINPISEDDCPSIPGWRMSRFRSDFATRLNDALEKEDGWFKFIILTAVGTGCRLGELVGLSWDNYIKEIPAFLVDQTVKYTPDKGTFLSKSTKTRQSVREIPIYDPDLKLLLETEYEKFLETKKTSGDDWNPYNLLFVRIDGEIPRPNSISEKFHRFITRNKLDGIRFHDLRHFYVSHLIMSGVPTATASHLAGHSKLSTTEDYYIDIIGDTTKQLLSIMQGRKSLENPDSQTATTDQETQEKK